MGCKDRILEYNNNEYSAHIEARFIQEKQKHGY